MADPWYGQLLKDSLSKANCYLDEFQRNPYFFFLLWPIVGAKITQHFGARPEYYGQWFKDKNGNPLGHEGVDFAMPWLKKTEGRPVLACAGGVVRVVDSVDDSNYGISVRIDHPMNGGRDYETVYAHLQSIVVSKGAKVNRGQIIGYAGNTGNSTGPHLHLTLKQKLYMGEGYYPLDDRGYGIVNPEKFLRKDRKGG